MCKKDLLTMAESTIPSSVSIPQSWAGLAVWAVGKWGAGAIFLVLLVPLYQDLKTSNARFASMTEANVRAMEALSHKMERTSAAIDQLAEDVRRIESQR